MLNVLTLLPAPVLNYIFTTLQGNENSGLKPPLPVFKEAALIPTLEFQTLALHPTVLEKTLSTHSKKHHLPLCILDYRLQKSEKQST